MLKLNIYSSFKNLDYYLLLVLSVIMGLCYLLKHYLNEFKSSNSKDFDAFIQDLYNKDPSN